MGASLLALAKSIYYFVYELVFICFPHFSPFCFSSSFRGVLFQCGRILLRVSWESRSLGANSSTVRLWAEISAYPQT